LQFGNVLHLLLNFQQGGQYLDHGVPRCCITIYYNKYTKVQLSNASYGSNCYFASPIYSHVGVASHNNSIYVASTNAYGYHDQELMSILNSLGFNATSNIQYAYPYSSAISSQYVVPPQDMPINERISYGDANYSVNYSQFSYDA
jgi:hypothetical protein